MGGEIEILRLCDPDNLDSGTIEISAAEWQELMRSVDGVRANDREQIARNPATGSEIRIPANPTVGEVFDADAEVWIPLISWDDGALSFYPPPDDAFFESSMWDTVQRIAHNLGAVIVDSRSGERMF